MSQERLRKVMTVLHHRQNDCAVLLDQVHKSHNLSAIIRNCDAVGIPNVHAVENENNDIRTYGNATAGSHKWIDLHRHASIESGVETAKNQGMTVYAAHLSSQAVDFREINYCKPMALLLGAEKPGVSNVAAELADEHIIIPMLGMVESLNVSVACAIILYELQRQRKEAGMYEQTPDIPKEQLFEWMQPKMARFYRERNLPYPELDEDGHIVP